MSTLKNQLLFQWPHKKSGGAYISHSGVIKKIDKYERIVIMTDKTSIPIEQISEIRGELFGELYE